MIRSVAVLLSLLVSTSANSETGALDVCNTLAKSGLVDTHSIVQQESVASHEFEMFCSQKGSLRKSYANKSRSFTAAFSRIADKFSGSAGAASGSSMTEQQFEAVCERGSGDFAREFSTEVMNSKGSILAAHVADCVNGAIGGHTDIVYGSVALSYDGGTLSADISRKARVEHNPLKFTGISPSTQIEKCTANSSDAFGEVLRNNLTIQCQLKKQDNGEYPALLRGFMSFRTVDDVGKSIEYDVRRPDKFNRQDVVNAIEAALYGSVVAFQRKDCPEGWRPYADAAGRVIVGTGEGNTDGLGRPLAKRGLGDYGGEEQVQLSVAELPSHRHGVYRHSGERLQSGGVNGSNSDDDKTHVREWETGAAGSDQPHNNMPPFIALTYCVRG